MLELERAGHPVRHGSIQNELSTGNDPSANKGKTNFAQAALLLQNSSSVYSRKVEYLYSLVFAALDELIASTQNVKMKILKRTMEEDGGFMDDDPDDIEPDNDEGAGFVLNDNQNIEKDKSQYENEVAGTKCKKKKRLILGQCWILTI